MANQDSGLVFEKLPKTHKYFMFSFGIQREQRPV
jgi:hypothetical protein